MEVSHKKHRSHIKYGTDAEEEVLINIPDPNFEIYYTLEGHDNDKTISATKTLCSIDYRAGVTSVFQFRLRQFHSNYDSGKAIQFQL